MEEGTKVWVVLMVAGLMVTSIGAVFIIGGNNEPEGPALPEGRDIWLTYRATGDHNGTEINGTYECFINKAPGSGWSAGIGYNFTGNAEDIRPILPKVLTWGSFIDDAEIITEWGVKQVQRCIYGAFDDEYRGLFISYTGAWTNIEYHVNYVAPGSNVTYDLIEIGIEDIESYDLYPARDSELLIEHRHANDHSGTSGPYSYMLIEPRDDEYYRIFINSTNSTIIVMDDENLSDMMNGGEFQFCSEWSVIDGGSTDYIINEGLTFFICFPTISNLSNMHIQVDIDVFER
ncbi:MAG: hypothetical protein LUQ09_05985 [Methanomassiliicoccales archaeon]|nr:hypothetical protein [Methanomassiliicoccales archaeon]